jgi:hypothetical protein
MARRRLRPAACHAAPRRRALALLCLAAALRLSAAAPYTYQTYAQVHARLDALAAAHPDLVTLESAQARYGLPSVGACGNSTDGGCKTWIVKLTERASLAGDPGRAEVLVSGEVHGDEVVGVHAVLAYLEMVVAKVRAGDAYFARMVRTRVVVALPMANAVGFYRGERGERQGSERDDVVDPNRDFAFDQDPKRCMQTVAARAINEVVREGLFRVLVTFHGGTNVIGYEWGDMTHCTGKVCKPAPDERFMRALGERMSEYAGGGAFERRYPVGTMGGLVYPVHGGMEDWAYGASWSGQAVKCQPETLGGYAAEKTVYGRATNRCVTYLVETAMLKRPPEESLGDDRDVLVGGGAGDGHVPRNARLLVTAVDSVEPYVVIVNGNRSRVGGGGDAGGGVVIPWYVGGAFTVDGTHLEWSDARGETHGTSPVLSGTAGAPVTGVRPTVFRAVVPKLPADGGPLYVRTAAIVDRSLAVEPADASPGVGVQTHIVGARMGRSWSYTNGDKAVVGRRVFYSQTVRAQVDASTGRVVLSADATDWAAAGLRAPSEEDVIGLLAALDGGTGARGKRPVMDPRDRNAVVSGIVGILMLLCVTCVIIVAVVRHHRKRRDEAEALFTVSEEDELKEPLSLHDRRAVDDHPDAASAAGAAVPPV